jgi:hypothetical protein
MGANDLPRNYRLKGLHACQSFLRLVRLATDVAEGDLEGYLIYLAVVCAGIERIPRDPALSRRFAEHTAVPDNLRTPVSRRAIAESLGIPRETVRRKIAELIAQGHLLERSGGVIAVGPVLARRNNFTFVRGAIKELERGASEIKKADRDLRSA